MPAKGQRRSNRTGKRAIRRGGSDLGTEEGEMNYTIWRGKEGEA